jgi:hypothetical protein
VVPNRIRRQANELIYDRKRAFQITDALQFGGHLLELLHAVCPVARFEHTLGLRALNLPSREWFRARFWLGHSFRLVGGQRVLWLHGRRRHNFHIARRKGRVDRAARAWRGRRCRWSRRLDQIINRDLDQCVIV